MVMQQDSVRTNSKRSLFRPMTQQDVNPSDGQPTIAKSILAKIFSKRKSWNTIDKTPEKLNFSKPIDTQTNQHTHPDAHDNRKEVRKHSNARWFVNNKPKVCAPQQFQSLKHKQDTQYNECNDISNKSILISGRLRQVSLLDSVTAVHDFVLLQETKAHSTDSKLTIALHQYETDTDVPQRIYQLSSNDTVHSIQDTTQLFGFELVYHTQNEFHQISKHSLYLSASEAGTYSAWIEALWNAIDRLKIQDACPSIHTIDTFRIERSEKCEESRKASASGSGSEAFVDNQLEVEKSFTHNQELESKDPHSSIDPQKTRTQREDWTIANWHHRFTQRLGPRNKSDLAHRSIIHQKTTHTMEMNGQSYTLDTRYEPIKTIGTGAYGHVIAALDTKSNTNIAIKKIPNVFDDLVDAKRIVREIRLLRHFNHKNITKLLDLGPPPHIKLCEIYLITELMETDLHQVIYSSQPMTNDHVKYFLYQMICALYHIHSAGVLHRDLKPSNILLNSNCDLKICDFGLARGGIEDQNSDFPQELTEYVVTRWYRAPEIMLNCVQYTEAVDIWAVGCIFAEMILRQPLFPGDDYIHQLELIIKVLGTPKQKDTEFVRNRKALRFLTNLPIARSIKWTQILGPKSDELAVDLLNKMLQFNPAKRISVLEALHHPYLATFYDASEQTEASLMDFSFDIPDTQLSKEAIVDLMKLDIEGFHPFSMNAMEKALEAHETRPRNSHGRIA